MKDKKGGERAGRGARGRLKQAAQLGSKILGVGGRKMKGQGGAPRGGRGRGRALRGGPRGAVPPAAPPPLTRCMAFRIKASS